MIRCAEMVRWGQLDATVKRVRSSWVFGVATHWSGWRSRRWLMAPREEIDSQWCIYSSDANSPVRGLGTQRLEG